MDIAASSFEPRPWFIVVVLSPYVLAFLRERWRVFVARNWPLAEARIVSRAVDSSDDPQQQLRTLAFANASLTYSYTVKGAEFTGTFLRRFGGKFYADEWIAQMQGATIPVRYNPDQPGISYAHIRRPFGGYIAPFTAMAAMAVCGGVSVYQAYEALDPDRDAKHLRIEASDWRSLDVPGAFHIRVPGVAAPTSRALVATVIEGAAPYVKAWIASANGGYFYAAVLQYPTGTLVGTDVLDRLQDGVSKETGNRQVSPIGSLKLNGHSGREFRLTHPRATMRAYAGGSRLYVFETDWDVPSDINRFFGSLRLEYS